MKTIGYFPLQCAKNSVPVLEAVLKALQNHGFKPVENSMDADMAFIWSVLWHGRMSQNKQVYEHYRSQQKPVIALDIGSLNRGVTWKIALNNITADGYYGNHENLDYDRPAKLGIKLKKQKSTSPYIIIAAQHRNSLQVKKLASVEQWITEKVQEIKKYTDRPIKIRPHPRSRLQQELLPKTAIIDTPNPLLGTYDSFDFRTDVHAIVNYNSGPGIIAAINGCRPVVDTSSLAWPVAINLKNIEKPYNVDATQWLVEICHTEYTLEEIEQGLWIKRLNLAN